MDVMVSLSLVFPSVPRKRDPPAHHHSESSTGSAAPQRASYNPTKYNPTHSPQFITGSLLAARCCSLLLRIPPRFGEKPRFGEEKKRAATSSFLLRPSIRPAAIRSRIEFSRVRTSRPDLTKNLRSHFDFGCCLGPGFHGSNQLPRQRLASRDNHMFGMR